MPRYTGALLSFVIIVVCLGINITQFPIAREMVDRSLASPATPNSHEENSSPNPAENILSDTAVDSSTAERPSGSAPSVTLPSSLVLQQTLQKQEQDKKNHSTAISPQEGSSAPPHGGSPSRISISATLVPSLPLVSNNGYEPIPADKIKPRSPSLASPKESLAQNKAETQSDESTAQEAEEGEPNPEDFSENFPTESSFQLSTPHPAYGEQVGKEETLDQEKPEPAPPSVPSSELSSEQVKPLPNVAQTPQSRANPWSAINVKIRPYDMVEAFRSSPLELDIPFADETEINTQDPYADP